ncbi:MAG TPA: hypothetical protein VG389_12265 [Myxococcota bacterium]|nr:hypothetical protein [Myxococcota bacterium]
MHTRAWRAALAAVVVLLPAAGCGGGDDAAAYEAAKAGGVPALVAYIRDGKTVAHKQDRCAKIYADISLLRETPLKAALAAPNPEAAIEAWSKENDQLLQAMDVCGVTGTAARDALAKMADMAKETSMKDAIKREIDADLAALDAAGDDRFKAWSLIAAGRADKRKVNLEDARGPEPALMLDKYFEKFPGPKVALGTPVADVEKAWGAPATKKTIDDVLDAEGKAVPTEEWSYPDKGIALAVVQAGTLQRLIVTEGWTDPIFGVQLGDDLASATSMLFGALALPGEVLGKEKVRLTADPDIYVEFAAWIDKDGVVQRLSLAKKGFIPYGPKPEPGKPGAATGAPATAAASGKPATAK